MDKTKATAILGALSTLGISPVAGEEPAAAKKAAATPSEFEYGPRSAEGITRGGKVLDLFDKLGAPYATYQVGDKTVYRWGHGRSQSRGATMSVERNELLVTATADGTISDVSFKPKFKFAGARDLMMMPPP